jgi:D-3-phosphoglycerate dehydrogenase
MKVLVKEKIGDSGIELLRSHGFEVDIGYDWTPEDLEARIGEYDGLLIRSATQVDAALLSKATKLRAVGRAGVGVDNVDVAAATKRGVVVANAPESNVVTAAEHTMALLLSLARNIPQAHASLVAGRWERSKYSGVELLEKTLGIIGFGRIGQLVAQRAQGFGMRVIAYDPFVTPEAMEEQGVEAASLERVFQESDFISAHAPHSKATHHLIGKRLFDLMKPSAIFVNTGRGKVVDEEALIEALRAGKLAGAGLDVLEQEPPGGNNPLLKMDNVILTAHVASATSRFDPARRRRVGQELSLVLTGRWPMSCVNPSVLAASNLRRWQPVSMERGPNS